MAGRDLTKAAKTRAAPKVQDAHPSYSENLPQDQDQMSLEEFMRRNPSARDLDQERTRNAEKIKQAQGRRGRPNMRDTERSLREKQQREQQSWYDDLPDSTKTLMSNGILWSQVKKYMGPGK